MLSCQSSLPRWCRGSVLQKRSTWPGHGELIRLCPGSPRSRGCLAPFAVGQTQAAEGRFKGVYTARLQVLFALGSKLPVPTITSRSPRFSSLRRQHAALGWGVGGAMSRRGDGETEMSVQNRARLLNGSRRLAEVSVFPSARCLRGSVSAPEIPRLRRRTPCPRATAALV